MAPRRAVDRLNSLHISAAQQQERKFSSAQSAINAFAKAAAAADTATDVAEELPSTYNEAIDHLLRGDNPPLATLPDGEVLSIAAQILQNIYRISEKSHFLGYQCYHYQKLYNSE